MSDKKVLVVFYSRGGNTRAVAEEFRKKFKADVEEIESNNFQLLLWPLRL